MFQTQFIYLEDKKILHLKMGGDYPRISGELDAFYESVKKECDIYNCRKVLLDYLGCFYDPPTKEIVKNTQRVIQYGLTEVYFAALIAPESEAHKKFKLFVAEAEMIRFLKKGNPKYHAFVKFDEAIQWLEEINL